ncbi:hypothetical protein HBI56_210910 [Parastagonospora nodorum]|nr:hypothetical protein HBH51_186780 [Parastagonospora nodorum]KAH3992715.1 hypothetical protein HBI10_212420 [Parastagonospora nodorum]KAH4029731.1 hypothetical protein HBI13_031730 [Parastagonospora nodorum]KAH4076142.1 hypothetical protein HBH50_001120 [Parastagonospora nodorum]KAH4081828.1 hypothetical protein HBH48_193910 [Parastagonospora nodorum]
MATTLLHRDSLSHFGVVGLAFLLSVCYVTFFLVRRLLLSPIRTVPGPLRARLSQWPMIIQGLKGRRIYELERLHRKYGSIVRIGPNEVSVADWRHMRAIYSNPKTVMKDPAFYDGVRMIGKHNIFQMTNPSQHAARRKLSSPPYALSSITRLDPLIQKNADDLVNRLILGSSSSASGTVDAYELCALFSLETMCQAAFAKEFDKADGPEGSLELLRSMEGSALRFLPQSLFPFLGSTGLGIKLPGFIGDAYRSHQIWEQQSRKMVDHFLEKSSADDKYLLSPIATGIDIFLDRRLSHEELIEEAMGYMFAGSGTTSSTLTYLLYAISLPKNLDIQERLREAVQKLPADDVTTIRQDPYVNAVIKETFRLFPTIVSTLPRLLLEPLQLDEYRLPAGTIVGMQNWMHHRDPVVFPNPDQFLPDRWLAPNASFHAMESSLTPFSIGRRNCIGQNLAWEELYIAVSAIMRAGLKLRLGPEMQPWEMEIVDRFNIAPKGQRLMLHVSRD